MKDEELLQAMTVMRLVNAGRYRDANQLLPTGFPGLQAWINLQSREIISPTPGALGDLVCAWTKYYRAEYPDAYDEFSKAAGSSVSWIKASAWIGMGKVCTDLGFFADAALWCSSASCLARRFEHDDLVATANGARGEIFLRSGYPRLAAEAFSLDMGLLPPSDRYRGRVMCYQAHAYRRLYAYSAAKLAYRTSSQQPGEQTAPYAYAGLAMLGTETDDVGLIDEVLHYAETFRQGVRVHSSIAWIYIGKARMLQQCGEPYVEWLLRAKVSLPIEYVFEHIWLDRWISVVKKQAQVVSERAIALRPFKPHVTYKELLDGYEFDREEVESELFNEGLASVNWSTDLDQLWIQRNYFLH
jgi:hypothetical protein